MKLGNMTRKTANTSDSCEFCGHEIPLMATCCPHCARPGLYPNVRASQVREEKDTLEKRYKAAVSESASRACMAEVQAFETVMGQTLRRDCSPGPRSRQAGRERQGGVRDVPPKA